MTHNLRKQIDTSLGAKRFAYASFTGTLARINTIGPRWSFTITPIGGPSRILCYFGKDDIEKVRQNLRNVVTIKGIATYGAKSPWPIQFRVERIEYKPEAPAGTWQGLPAMLAKEWQSAPEWERELVLAGVDLD